MTLKLLYGLSEEDPLLDDVFSTAFDEAEEEVDDSAAVAGRLGKSLLSRPFIDVADCVVAGRACPSDVASDDVVDTDELAVPGGKSSSGLSISRAGEVMAAVLGK